MIQQARVSGQFQELIIPETIELCIASYDDHSRAKEWAVSRGLREADMVTGAPILSDEIARARAKLKTEAKQLPPDKTTVVIIEAVENLFLLVYDINALAGCLGEELKKYPQLYSAVFYHTFDAGKSESYSRSIGSHLFVNGARSDGSTEQALVVRNTNHKTLLHPNTLEKLETALAKIDLLTHE
jgi:hypothetical protein